MKIIFLDIDGVLNNDKYLDSKENEVDIMRNYYHKYKYELDIDDEISFFTQRRLLDIDFNKVDMIIDICNKTNAKVVIISTWKIYEFWSYIKEYLISYGLPIIDETNDYKIFRGKEIQEYLDNHNVDDYVIIDDELFKDYDAFKEKLIQTDYYGEGFTEEHKGKALKLLK